MHKVFLLVILIGALIFGAATSIAIFRWPYGMSIVPVDGGGTADYSWVPALVLWGLYLLFIWLLSVFTKLPVTPATVASPGVV
jgi:hypothetical protein